jgi:hypothetical protein
VDAVAAPAGLADAPVARAVPADVAELPGLEDDGDDSDADEPRQAAGRALPPELTRFGPRPDCSRGCAHNHQVAAPDDSPAGLEPSPGASPGTSGGVAQQRAGGNAPAAAGLEPANAMRLDRLIATAGAHGAATAVAGAIVGAALQRGAVAAGNVGDGEEDTSGGGADARATVAPEPPLPPVDVVMADANPVLPRDALHTATTRAGRAARAREERTMATTITTRTGGVLSIHAHPDLEPAAFPNLYPYGTNHFGTNREQPIGIAAYFTNRVQNADPRFQLPVYLAWAVSLSVYLQLRNQISVSLRIQQNGRAPRLNTLRRQVAALHRQQRRQDAAVPDPAAAGEAAPPRPAAALLAGGRPGRWNLYRGGGVAPAPRAAPGQLEEEENEAAAGADDFGNIEATARAILSNIRGTPAYWADAASDLFAMLRSIGPPTWFLTLSANELGWDDLVLALMHAPAERARRAKEALGAAAYDRATPPERVASARAVLGAAAYMDATPAQRDASARQALGEAAFLSATAAQREASARQALGEAAYNHATPVQREASAREALGEAAYGSATEEQRRDALLDSVSRSEMYQLIRDNQVRIERLRAGRRGRATRVRAPACPSTPNPPHSLERIRNDCAATFFPPIPALPGHRGASLQPPLRDAAQGHDRLSRLPGRGAGLLLARGVSGGCRTNT